MKQNTKNAFGNIVCLPANEIDKLAWDECISKAGNGLVYAYSYYLDALADNWDGLVLNNYEAVMPLPWRKKWGIFYLYQPFVTAQLGLYADNVDAGLLQLFLNSIPVRFQYWDFPLNYKNLLSITPFALQQRANYVLSLDQPYELLRKNYRENIRRNIKRAEQYGCLVRPNVEVEAIIALAEKQATGATAKDFKNFCSLYQLMQQNGQAKTYGVYGTSGDLLSSCVYFFSHKRAYYILVGNHPNGRTLGASHLLIDAFIKDHAASDLLLDFEGSDIRNLAFFYSSFGATQEPYAHILNNRLPLWAKWFKK